MYQINLHIEVLEEGNFHTIVIGSLNSLRMRMVLDTGASHSCIDAEIARTFFPGLSITDAEGVKAGVGGNEFMVQMADFHNFYLGDFHLPLFKNLPIVDLTHINYAYRLLERDPIQMILGNDFLIEHQAIINYQENLLYFN